MKKFMGKIVMNSLVIALIIWVASIVFYFSYMDYSFFIDGAFTVILFFANMSGGTPLSNYEASEAIWKIQKTEDIKINVGAVFYGSLLYTVMSFIIWALLSHGLF